MHRHTHKHTALSGLGGCLQVAPNSKEAKKQQQTEDVLNSILPPREWQESGQLWVQSVSATPATRALPLSLRIDSGTNTIIVYLHVRIPLECR